MKPNRPMQRQYLPAATIRTIAAAVTAALLPAAGFAQTIFPQPDVTITGSPITYTGSLPLVNGSRLDYFGNPSIPYIAANPMAAYIAYMQSNSPIAFAESDNLPIAFPNNSARQVSGGTMGDLYGTRLFSTDPTDPTDHTNDSVIGQVTHVSAYIQITQALDSDLTKDGIQVRFGLNSDDGSRLRINGQDVLDYGAGHSNTNIRTATATFGAAGLYSLDVYWYNLQNPSTGLTLLEGKTDGSVFTYTDVLPTAQLFTPNVVPEAGSLSLLLPGVAALGLVCLRRKPKL